MKTSFHRTSKGYRFALWAAAVLVAGAAQAGPSDGAVVGAVKLVDNGPDAERLTLVLVSEGYTEAELPAFAEHAQQFVDTLLSTAPFASQCRAFNVWRIDVASLDSGADDPAGCAGGTGAAVDTFFDATFCRGGADRRLLGYDELGAIDVLDSMVPAWDQGIVLVNSPLPGGVNGTPMAVSLGGAWDRQAIHGLGHALFGLADEYDAFAGSNYADFCPVCAQRIGEDLAARLPPNLPPVCDAGGPYVAECAGELTTVTLDGSAATDPDCDPLTFVWDGPFVDAPATGATVDVDFPGVGVYPVTLEVSDGMHTSTCQVDVTVQDTIPPDLAVIVEPNVLWPPNHKYVDIQALVSVEDLCDADVAVRLVSVTSTELDNDRGDGNTQDDVNGADFGTDDRAFQLRAERSGRGNGRVYHILYQAEDASGNLSEVEAFVVVPKNQGRYGYPCIPGAPATMEPRMADAHGALAYRWEALPCATWYELWINRDGEPWHDQWYKKGHAVGRLREIVENHPAGTYEWWVRAWSPGGAGPWAPGGVFTWTPSDGREAFSTSDVVLQWEEEVIAPPDWYQFWVSRDGRPFWNRWLRAEEIMRNGSNAELPMPFEVPYGRYQWWHRSWSHAAGMERWTRGADFDVGRALPLAPTGAVSGADVTVVWDDQYCPQAEWFQFWIGQDGAKVWSRWIPAADTAAVPEGRAYALPQPLPDGELKAYIRTWRDQALGPWSEPLEFTTTP